MSLQYLTKYEMTDEPYPKSYKIVEESGAKKESNDIEFTKDYLSFNQFRKRKLPVYLLSIDRTDYPVYYSKENLSMAILVRQAEIENPVDQVASSISVTVHLEKYLDLFEKNTKNTTSKRKAKQIMSEYILETQLPLISTANEAVKKIVGDAWFKYKIEIKKLNPSYFFALKVEPEFIRTTAGTSISTETPR